MLLTALEFVDGWIDIQSLQIILFTSACDKDKDHANAYVSKYT